MLTERYFKVPVWRYKESIKNVPKWPEHFVSNGWLHLIVVHLFMKYNEVASGNENFLFWRLKWPLMLKMSHQRWGGPHPMGGQEREPSLRWTKRWVISNFFSPCKTIDMFLFSLLSLCSAVTLVDDTGLEDSIFKTPPRSILRNNHILSEMDPASPHNSASRKIYTPIVRFLTPSKESK